MPKDPDDGKLRLKLCPSHHMVDSSILNFERDKKFAFLDFASVTREGIGDALNRYLI